MSCVKIDYISTFLKQKQKNNGTIQSEIKILYHGSLSATLMLFVAI